MTLLLTHPELPTCEDCQRWLYDDNWKRAKKLDKPIKRPAESLPPCYKCPKSGDGKPNPEAELSERNQHTLEYYYRIKAGARMPDDEIVQINCAVIRFTEDCIERNSQALPLLFASALLGAGKKR